MALNPSDAQPRTALFGGEGTVTTWSRLPRGAHPFSAAIWCELTPSGRVGAHRQQRDPEILLSIEGEGEVLVGGAAHRFTRGDVVFVPAGEVLEIRNLSQTDTLVYTIIKAERSNG